MRWVERRRPAAYAALAVIVLLAAWPVVALRLHGTAILHGDSVLHDLPLQRWLARALRHGWRFWSEEAAFGFPLYAEGTMAPFYPATWLLFGLLPPIDAHNLYPFLHFAITGCCVFALGRRLGMEIPWSVVAALLVSQSPLVLSTTYNATYAATLAWSTAVLWRLEVLRRRPDPVRAVKLAVPMALMLLSGYPQAAYATVVLAGAVLGTHALCSPTRGWRALLALIGATALAFGLSAVQWLPLAELVAHSVRSAGVALQAAMPWPYFARGIFLQERLEHYLNRSVDTGSMIAVGPGSLLVLLGLGLAPLVRGRWPWLYLPGVWLCIGLGTLPLSWPYRVFYEWLPGLNRFRTAGPWLWVTLVPMVLFAVQALRGLAGRPGRLRVLGAGVAVPLALWFAVFVSRGLVLTPAYAWKLGLLAGFLGLLLLARMTGSDRVRRALPWLLVLFAVVEGLAIKQAGLRSFPRAAVEDPPRVVEFLRAQGAAGRPVRVLHHPTVGPFVFTHLTVAFYYPGIPGYERRMRDCVQLLCPYLYLTTGAAVFGSHNALPLARRADVESVLHDEVVGRSGTPPGSRLIDRLGVRFVLVYGQPRHFPLASDLRPVWETPVEALPLRVVENPTALPGGFSVDRVHWVEDRPAMLEAVRAGGERRPVVAERVPLWRPPVPLVRLLRALASEGDVVLRETAGDIRTGLRFLPIPPYPGWTAWVDGEPVDIHPAEGLGMVFEVPAGARSLEVRFVPWSFFAGLTVTLGTLLLAGVVVLRARRARRRDVTGS